MPCGRMTFSMQLDCGFAKSCCAYAGLWDRPPELIEADAFTIRLRTDDLDVDLERFQASIQEAQRLRRAHTPGSAPAVGNSVGITRVAVRLLRALGDRRANAG